MQGFSLAGDACTELGDAFVTELAPPEWSIVYMGIALHHHRWAPPPSPARPCYGYRAHSAGLIAGNFARFHVNGDLVFARGAGTTAALTRGFCFVVVDPDSFEVLSTVCFDTHRGHDPSNWLTTAAATHQGMVLMAAVIDQGAQSDASYAALRSAMGVVRRTGLKP